MPSLSIVSKGCIKHGATLNNFRAGCWICRILRRLTTIASTSHSLLNHLDMYFLVHLPCRRGIFFSPVAHSGLLTHRFYSVVSSFYNAPSSLSFRILFCLQTTCLCNVINFIAITTCDLSRPLATCLAQLMRQYPRLTLCWTHRHLYP